MVLAGEDGTHVAGYDDGPRLRRGFFCGILKGVLGRAPGLYAASLYSMAMWRWVGDDIVGGKALESLEGGSRATGARVFFSSIPRIISDGLSHTTEKLCLAEVGERPISHTHTHTHTYARCPLQVKSLLSSDTSRGDKKPRTARFKNKESE
jgi:hypothetical protein